MPQTFDLKASLTQKRGPLPVWGWILALVAVLFVAVWWRRNRAAGTATEAATGSQSSYLDNQAAPPVFVVPQAATPAVNVGPFNNTITVPEAPPGAGAPPPTTGLPSSVGAPGPATNLYEWADRWNRDYGRGYPTAGAAFIALFGKDENDSTALNRGYRKYIAWRAGAKGPEPYFNPNWSGRNPPLGIPPVRLR